ncbi:MAG: hypothetical protein WD037_09400 [Balneolales bacterium]
MNKDDLDVEYSGSEETNGVETANLRFSGDVEMNLFVDEETNLPVMMRYSEFNPQSGEDLIEEYFSKWNENGGLSVAFSSKSFSNGEISNEVLLENHIVK